MDTLSYDIARYGGGSYAIDYNSLKFNGIPISQDNEYGIFDVVKQE